MAWGTTRACRLARIAQRTRLRWISAAAAQYARSGRLVQRFAIFAASTLARRHVLRWLRLSWRRTLQRSRTTPRTSALCTHSLRTTMRARSSFAELPSRRVTGHATATAKSAAMGRCTRLTPASNAVASCTSQQRAQAMSAAAGRCTRVKPIDSAVVVRTPRSQWVRSVAMGTWGSERRVAGRWPSPIRTSSRCCAVLASCATEIRLTLGRRAAAGLLSRVTWSAAAVRRLGSRTSDHR
jgi:hypothetical protein